MTYVNQVEQDLKEGHPVHHSEALGAPGQELRGRDLVAEHSEVNGLASGVHLTALDELVLHLARLLLR